MYRKKERFNKSYAKEPLLAFLKAIHVTPTTLFFTAFECPIILRTGDILA